MKELVVFFLVLVVLQVTHAQIDPGEPLFLTPYLEENRTDEARIAAEVHLEDFQNVTSYAGYFTVDKLNDANLYFWFFPSIGNYAEDPVLLWLSGGPGTSSLFALFDENGPFTVLEGNIVFRDFSWHRNHSVLYIDQPVGTGFSFTKGPLLTDQTQIGNHLYSALIQFFTLFSELQSHEFYISGESYAGKYIPSTAYAIHKYNPDASLKINLQGLLIGNGFVDPINQFEYGDLLYEYGFIDRNALQVYHSIEQDDLRYLQQENYEVATVYTTAIIGLFSRYARLYTDLDVRKFSDDTPTDWQGFLQYDDVRKALHVGNTSFPSNTDVFNTLYSDYTTSVVSWVSELLNHYRVLIYSGQSDLNVPYWQTKKFLNNLNFSAASEYKKAQRQFWTKEGRVVGYVKTAGNLTEVLIRNAGHFVPTDQPLVAYDLVYKFIRNLAIDG